MKKVILLISLIFSTLSSEPFFQLVESQTIEVFLENASVFLDKHIDTEKIDFKNLKITAYPSTLKTIEYILKKRGCSFRGLEVLNP
jgi:hypothetical protein